MFLYPIWSTSSSDYSYAYAPYPEERYPYVTVTLSRDYSVKKFNGLWKWFSKTGRMGLCATCMEIEDMRHEMLTVCGYCGLRVHESCRQPSSMQHYAIKACSGCVGWD